METRTLFMIGNGFDLAHGLRTAYMDFFEYLFEIEQSFLVKPNSRFNWYLELGPDIISNILELPVSKGIASILNLNDISKLNVWYSYFKKVATQKQNIETWIDFEKELQAVIQKIDTDTHPEGTYGKNGIAIFMQHMNCHKCYNNYPDKLDKLFYQLEINHPISPIFFYSNTALEESIRKELALFLYDELRRYTFCFELYLACIMPILPSKFPQHTPDPLFRFFETGTRNNFLLSFNYTTTTEERYKIVNIQYIHGKLRNPDELEAHMLEPYFQLSTPLILGFHSDNPNSDTNPTPFLFFEKFFQRILHETKDYIYSWINNSTQNCQFRTVIYGHSLDSSDGDFIKLIFEKSCSITVYFHDPGVLPSLITNLVSIFGREEVNRIHSQGKLRFVPADILKVREPEANYAPI